MRHDLLPHLPVCYLGVVGVGERARDEGKGWVKAEQIAQNLGLPFPMTAKVLQMLAHAYQIVRRVTESFNPHERHL